MKRPLQPDQHIEALADRKADKHTYWGILFFIALSWFVISSSGVAELNGNDTRDKIQVWMDQGTSHAMIAICVFIIPFALSKGPLSREKLVSFFIWHVGACIVFSVLHILSMVGLRTVLYPFIFREVYDFGITEWQNWMYEFRKDAYTYMLVLLIFQTGRQLTQTKMELDATRKDAHTNQRILLKSGGRSIFLIADEVIWAKAASNYVEIRTEGRTHLARMTLVRLKLLLAEAGQGHAQVHRSYLVRKKSVREIVPEGEGDAKLLLANGEIIPLSRGYRSSFEAEVKV